MIPRGIAIITMLHPQADAKKTAAKKSIVAFVIKSVVSPENPRSRAPKIPDVLAQNRVNATRITDDAD